MSFVLATRAVRCRCGHSVEEGYYKDQFTIGDIPEGWFQGVLKAELDKLYDIDVLDARVFKYQGTLRTALQISISSAQQPKAHYGAIGEGKGRFLSQSLV